MKRFDIGKAILIALLLQQIGAPPLHAKEDDSTPIAKPIELTGEVVDAWCYSSQVMGPGRGPKHKACALACAHGGVTLGIVDDQGTLYIAAKHKGFTGCQELLMPYVAKRVKIVGWIAHKGGCNVLKIKSVTEAK
jgi:hypothetical protein